MTETQPTANNDPTTLLTTLAHALAAFDTADEPHGAAADRLRGAAAAVVASASAELGWREVLLRRQPAEPDAGDARDMYALTLDGTTVWVHLHQFDEHGPTPVPHVLVETGERSDERVVVTVGEDYEQLHHAGPATYDDGPQPKGCRLVPTSSVGTSAGTSAGNAEDGPVNRLTKVAMSDTVLLPLANGRSVRVRPALADRVVGVDADNDVVVPLGEPDKPIYMNDGLTEFLVALTPCCQADGKGSANSPTGTCCRTCYDEVHYKYGTPATVAVPVADDRA